MTERDPTAERHAEVDRAFAAALDLGEAERRDYLSWLRSSDPPLAAAVDRLLAAAARPDPRLDPALWIGHALRLGIGSTQAGSPGRTDERVGPYRLVAELGRGGMSVVYLAERADGLFHQRVALKFLSVPHALGVLRFEQERRILAGLSHPHIARLLDGGTDAAGRPYIVMEHVEGRPLGRYCSEVGADLHRRLELLDVVAEAVEYAHRNLVVHRDIKPSNILVTDDGVVKLLDFGIAKLMTDPEPGADHPAGAPATATLTRLLTPEYASPEQVRGERITTASDVYQLGAVLYELLSGRRPHDLSGATASDIEHAVCHQDPVPPSAVAPPPGAASSLPQVTLRRRSRGDLDTIVLKALSKEPERRYASVAELRDDLRRFRDGLPVRARKPTVRYRTTRFVRRHRAAVGVAVVLAALLTGYVATVTVQSRRIAVEAAKAAQVKEILASLFTAANPGVRQGAELTALDLLDAGAVRVANELKDQPEVRAEMMALLGEVYGTLGRYDEAGDLLEDALGLQRELLGRSDPEVAETAHRLAQIRHIQGRFDEAEGLLWEALGIRRASFDERSWQVGVTLDELGDLLHTRGALAEAEAILRQALAVHTALGLDAATVHRHLANVRRDRGSFEDAEALYRGSLTATEERFGPVDPIGSLTRSELALLLTEMGRFEEADSLLAFNRSVYAALYPDGHPMVGTTLRNLGVLRLRQGLHSQARVALEEALEVYRRTLTGATSLIPRTERYLAEVLMSMGDLDAATQLGLHAVDRLRELGLSGHPAVADALETVALASFAQGRPVHATELLAESLAVRARFSVIGDPRMQVGRQHLAAALAGSQPSVMPR